jgi:two-component system, NtrC family, sensor kinase
MVASAAPRSINSRLIALSQLACVALFGALLVQPWRASSPVLGTVFVVACATFAVAVISLALYGTYALAIERRAGEALQHRMTAEQELKAKLEQDVVERTLELDDAQRVIHRMWWLGQQITLELDPRRVVDRFLEAVADIAQADGAALGLLENDGTIVVTAANGLLEPLAGERMPAVESVQGRVIQGGRTWCVADVETHRAEVHGSLFPKLTRPLHGVAVVPIQRRGERIGAVTIGSERVHTFSALELERVEAIADLLSFALANAELFESMRQAEWRFRTLFRAAPDAVLTVLQTTGRIREANDAVRAVFGLETYQVIGRTLLELIVPEDRPALEEALGRAFAGAQARVEVHVQTPSGGTRVVALAANGLPGADPPSALLVGRDMTQERDMRLRLMESDRLAAVGELVAGVAHEVNNPLCSISAFAQLLLRDDDLTPAHRESIEVIRAETTRASQVVKDLLTFARRSDPQREPLDLNGVVGRTLRLRQYQFAEASVRVQQELAPELPAVLGDARQLQQVCLNLVTNAVHAMTAQGGGTLTMRTSHGDGRVVLEVSDSGPGISAGARAHVFEPFFTTKGEGEGTGLGLSVSYGIVKAHGGTIEVADSGPLGTTFRVGLPAASARPGARATPADAPMPVLRSPLAGIRLLFVDDEPTLRSGMEAFGRLRGFTVVTAGDGVEALSQTRALGVDAVVCDLRMPGMDGYAFHDQLREERPGLAARTVFVTGDVVSTETRETVLRQPVLTKPFSFDQIEEAVIAVLRGAPYRPSERPAAVPR